MKQESVAVTVRILEKEYRIACAEGEQEALLESARYLNSVMKGIRDGGKIVGSDRVAVMAALNLAHELLQYKSQDSGYNKSMGSRVKGLQDKLESALNRSKQMEL